MLNKQISQRGAPRVHHPPTWILNLAILKFTPFTSTLSLANDGWHHPPTPSCCDGSTRLRFYYLLILRSTPVLTVNSSVGSSVFCEKGERDSFIIFVINPQQHNPKNYQSIILHWTHCRSSTLPWNHQGIAYRKDYFNIEIYCVSSTFRVSRVLRYSLSLGTLCGRTEEIWQHRFTKKTFHLPVDSKATENFLSKQLFEEFFCI